MKIKTGDRVWITGRDHGTCIGTIIEIRRPEQLPELRELPGCAGAPRVDALRRILAELEAMNIYMITYTARPGHDLIFAALERSDGSIQDLRQQPLTLTPVTDSEAMTMDHSEATRTRTAERYLNGELTAREAAEFEEHFFNCPSCAEELTLENDFAQNVKAVFREMGRSAR